MTDARQLKRLVLFRLRQADETLGEASVLLERSAFRGCINRSYYAMFYALLGLLATRGFSTSKHSAAISLFDREFVKSGVFSKDLSKSLHRAFDERQTHDYGEMLEADRESAQGLLGRSHEFVLEMRRYLASLGFQEDDKDV